MKALADLKERKPFDLYGYCLMGNHIHLLLRPREGSVSRIVQSLLVSHTQRYHRFHRSSGHVWQGRFKSPLIQDDEHLLTVLRYIEANPLRARLVEHAGKYRWSSFACHGDGAAAALLDPLAPYEALAAYPAVRQRRWSAYVHQTAGGTRIGGHPSQQRDGPALRRAGLGRASLPETETRPHDPPRGRPRRAGDDGK